MRMQSCRSPRPPGKVLRATSWQPLSLRFSGFHPSRPQSIISCAQEVHINMPWRLFERLVLEHQEQLPQNAESAPVTTQTDLLKIQTAHEGNKQYMTMLFIGFPSGATEKGASYWSTRAKLAVLFGWSWWHSSVTQPVVGVRAYLFIRVSPSWVKRCCGWLHRSQRKHVLALTLLPAWWSDYRVSRKWANQEKIGLCSLSPAVHPWLSPSTAHVCWRRDSSASLMRRNLGAVL